MKRTISASCDARNRTRSARPTRHSKRSARNFRMPRPLCACGLPNALPNSSSFSTTSAHSSLGSARRRFCTSASMDSDFLNSFPQIVRQDDEFAFAPGLFDARIVGRDECVQLRGGDTIFPPGVIRRFNFHRTQRDDRCPRQDADIFAFNCSGQPFPKILLRVGNP